MELISVMKRLLIIGVAAIAAGANANLISDGGFEMGDVFNPQFTGGPWTTQYGYASNNNQTSGDPLSIWHEGNMRVMDVANNAFSGHQLWDPVAANEGRVFLAVNGATNQEFHPFVLTQSFTYTGSGPLTLSFDSVNLYKRDANGASTLQAYLDGVSIGTTFTQLDNIWRTATFTGNVSQNQSGIHTLMIVADTTQASGNDFGLDNIRLQAVPEPFSMSLMGGAALVGFLRMRRRARQS